MSTKGSYIGDGAYVSYDGYGLMLYTENGICRTNEVYLEPDVYKALTEFVERLKEMGEIRYDAKT